MVLSSNTIRTFSSPQAQQVTENVSEMSTQKPADWSPTQSHNEHQRLSLQQEEEVIKAIGPERSNSEHVIVDINKEDTNHLSFRAVERVDVQARELSISVKVNSLSLWGLLGVKKVTERPKETKILNNVSADIPAGQLMAIIGGSGSGKTSMLNVMAHRMLSGGNLAITGQTSYNGHASLKRVRYAYVMQQDVLIPTLTVRETLLYSAELRLPFSTQQERLTAVEEVILQLGLKECADTRIGDNSHKGCSGGEKRRTSIGVQLLANPSVLFLDEPTTGLDATSAFQVVKTLKNLAQRDRTIIITIHQPRSEIWGLFDRVTLLSRGECLYSGPAPRAPEYFSSLGYSLPLHVNVADFLIDLSAIDTRNPEAEQETSARVSSLVASWEKTTEVALEPITIANANLNEIQNGIDGDITARNTGKTPLGRQILVLTRRTFLTTCRDPMGVFGSFLEAIGMGLICGFVFFQLGGSLSGIRSKQAALYLACALQGYLVLLYETYRLTTIDIKVFDRERVDGVVGVLGWLVSRRLAHLLIEDIPVPLLFSIIYYFMIGFQSNIIRFLRFFSVLLIGQFIAVSFATLSVGISRNFAEASLVSNLSYTVQSMASGFFIQISTMPVYIRWTHWISYVFYSFAAVAANEFKGSFYDCPNGGPEDAQCIEYRGDFILKSLGFNGDWLTEPILACVAAVIIFNLIAILLLQFLVVDISVPPKQKNDGDASSGKEKMEHGTKSDVQIIDVVLDNIRLDILKKGILPLFDKDSQILKGVSTKFEAGKLNVILGPSGSGKSTLLNLIARRLHSSLFTRYRSSGHIFLNSAIPTDSVIRSLCSYVTQDDDALLPSLTVRETLHFAAGLRLPKWMSTAEKKRRAEGVIVKMGLKDCADTLIGSEFIKGISGGEKRRVSIAVQILTEPKILLVDEPTSGLDAFTASSILSVLKGLADEGRTVILTIHQSRSDLFDKFGNVLLLANGSAVYSGEATQMLPYFAAAGYECPRDINPTDFVLDLVAINLQHTEKELVSRAKVQSLIDRFSHKNAIPQDGEHRVISLPAELGRMQREKTPFRVAYPILLKRGFLNLRRQPDLVVARLMQVIGLGIILALYFAHLGNNYYSVQSRAGFVQQLTLLYFIGMLQNVAIYPSERDVFYREYNDSAYTVSTFFFSYVTSEIPFEIISGLVFSVLVTFAAGLHGQAMTEWKLFFILAFNAFCVTSCGESLGIAFNTLFSHTGFAVNITSAVLSIGTFMAGIMSTNMPGFLRAMNHISPVKYAVGSAAPWVFRGFKFICPTPDQQIPESGGECIISTGEQVLQLYRLDKENPQISLGALAACVVAYRIVAYAVLRAKLWASE